MSIRNVALLSGNHFALTGMKALMSQTGQHINVAISARTFPELKTQLSDNHIDIIVLIECNQDMAGIDWLKHVSEIRKQYPRLLIWMCTAQTASLSLFNDYVDAWFSLRETLIKWQHHLYRLRNVVLREPKKLSRDINLTALEWTILKDVKRGITIQHIAQRNNISYRKVSLLKNIAMRKLGLRNKTALLVFLTR